MKRFISIVLICIVLFSLAACQKTGDNTESVKETKTESSESVGAKEKNITIASSSTGGATYYIGAAQSKILSDRIRNCNFTVEATDGSIIMNGPIVQNDPDCMGLIILESAMEALEGEYADLPGIKLDKMRLVQAGHAALLQFVTLKETGVTSINNLKGKRVATAGPGSAARAVTLQILDALGYEESDFASLTAMSYTDMADALKDGTIDVAVFCTGIPGAAISDLNSTRDMVMLQVPQETLDTVIAEHPGYGIYTLTGGTYSDISEDYITLGLPLGLFCNADMDDDLVYEITKVLNESTEELTLAHVDGAAWNTENTLAFYNDGSIPFHPGAARYYDEIQGK